jgi:hypothetical protein
VFLNTPNKISITNHLTNPTMQGLYTEVDKLPSCFRNSSDFTEDESSSPVQRRTQLVIILNQVNALHALAPYFSTIHFNIVLSSIIRSLKRLLLCAFPIALIWTTYLELITLITTGEEYKSWSFLLCNLLHSPISSSVLDLNIHLSIVLLSHTSSMEAFPQRKRSRFTPI